MFEEKPRRKPIVEMPEEFMKLVAEAKGLRWRYSWRWRIKKAWSFFSVSLVATVAVSFLCGATLLPGPPPEVTEALNELDSMFNSIAPPNVRVTKNADMIQRFEDYTRRHTKLLEDRDPESERRLRLCWWIFALQVLSKNYEQMTGVSTTLSKKFEKMYDDRCRGPGGPNGRVAEAWEWLGHELPPVTRRVMEDYKHRQIERMQQTMNLGLSVPSVAPLAGLDGALTPQEAATYTAIGLLFSLDPATVPPVVIKEALAH